MALHFAASGTTPNPANGNANVTLGGCWNAPNPSLDLYSLWSDPFGGATAFQVVITFKPDNPFVGGVPAWNYFPIVHNSGDPSGQACWRLGHSPGGSLLFDIMDSGNIREWVTAGNVIVPGQWHRILAKWRGSDQTVSLWVNGVHQSADSWVPAGDGSAITHLTLNGAGQYAPLQIGGIDQVDGEPSAGAYAEVAFWNVWGPDSDATLYGQGYPPSMLSVPGRLKYVSLRTLGATEAAGYFNVSIPAHAHLVDEWDGSHYGDALITYNYGGGPAGDFQSPPTGAFDSFSLVTHPPMQTQMALGMKPDKELLPQHAFQTFERMGTGHVGKRSANIQTLGAGATQADLQGALNALTGWGDEITIDPGAHIVLSSTLLPPDTTGWTVDDSTPRMPPPAQRFTLSAIRARSAISARAAVSARRPQGDPSYVLIRSSAVASLPQATFRHIPLSDGTVVHGLHESSKATLVHQVFMPTIEQPANGSLIMQSVGGRWHRRLYFDGIDFSATTAAQDAGTFFSFEGGVYGIRTWHLEPARRKFPQYIVWNRCLFRCDPLGIGTGGTTILESGDIAWCGFFNFTATNFYGYLG